MNLEGKVALVTGGSRGIGRAVALKLGALGAKVAVNYRGKQQEADEVVAAIKAAGSDAVALQGDVSVAAEAQKLVEETVKAFGRLDILVNNAGITRDQLMMRMSEADWDAVLDTNLKGSFLLTKAAQRTMLKQRYGRIINITSVIGQMGGAGQSNYSAAKAGLIGLTKSAARELGSRSITVNAVAPGFIDTDMTGGLSEEIKKKALEQIPLERFGKPEDVAEAVAFLAGDAAAYITGQVLAVDGGMVMM
ncbi:MAG: 3-oxoacyl-[acyl-carrier-protein] reductase [Chloroflexi bacterium]|uniref:3-oxoacyl-[acyl-carrier-protein] reductase n=1 Tax=Candidatus Chlorohelix allophototropha TaxID=3003348 RepID=A0A8T7M974_9CHLR|nr:3-oxoacyl-[acyl-carrier-protein] reductase [Chloroflexota bacterium]WJW68506.1 3-oxoacyl-[acyl-carrier-protein] reductase [Chloroflexota bacterium L227-S17]